MPVFKVEGTAIGFMSVCTDVNVDLLNECFELGPFHGLHKQHEDDELEAPRTPSPPVQATPRLGINFGNLFFSYIFPLNNFVAVFNIMDKSNWNRRHIAIFSEPERPSSAKSDKSTSSTMSKRSNKASEHLEEPLDTSKASSRHSSIQMSRSNSQSMLIKVGYWFLSV